MKRINEKRGCIGWTYTFGWSEKASLRWVHWNEAQDEKWGPAWEDLVEGAAGLDALGWECVWSVPDLRCIPRTQNLDLFSLWFVFINSRALKTCLSTLPEKLSLDPECLFWNLLQIRNCLPPLWAGKHFDFCMGQGQELGQEAGIYQSFTSPFTFHHLQNPNSNPDICLKGKGFHPPLGLGSTPSLPPTFCICHCVPGDWRRAMRENPGTYSWPIAVSNPPGKVEKVTWFCFITFPG